MALVLSDISKETQIIVVVYLTKTTVLKAKMKTHRMLFGEVKQRRRSKGRPAENLKDSQLRLPVVVSFRS